MDRISVETLKNQLDKAMSIIMLDVREPWEYQICQIEGSVNIPMSQIVSRTAELDKDATIIVICHHGSRSYQVACYLESCGFSCLQNLEGGINAWASTVDRTMAIY